MITSVIGWIIFGLVIGALARFVVPGPDPMTILSTIGLGVAGSYLGGLLGNLLFGGETGVHPASYLGSLIGAVILLIALRQYKRRNLT